MRNTSLSKLILMLISISIFSCEQESTQIKVFKYIITGDAKSQNVVYHDIIDTSMQFDIYGSPSHLLGQSIILNLIRDDSTNYKFYLHSNGSPGGYDAGVGVFTNLKSFIAIDTFVDKNNFKTVSPKVFKQGDTINEKLLFKNNSFVNLASTSGLTLGEPYVNGFWNNKTNSYLGIKLVTNKKDTLFGWIKIDVINYSKITLKDFAYRK